jgi:hypothetical protein
MVHLEHLDFGHAGEPVGAGVETGAQNEDSPMPVSDLHQADASANQSARVEMPPYLVSAPDQPVNGVESPQDRP